MEQLFDIKALKKLLSDAVTENNFKDMETWKKVLIFVALSYTLGLLIFNTRMKEVQDEIYKVVHPVKSRPKKSRQGNTYPVEIRRA